jgi:hypothetical protein
MKRITPSSAIPALCFLVQVAVAQNPPTPSAQPSQSSTSQSRPDARYPNPSGQDSQPRATAPKRATGSAPGKGNPEGRGSRTAQQSAPVQQVAKQGSYQGNKGKKADPGTACSSARPTPNGGVDCGTGGKAATSRTPPK